MSNGRYRITPPVPNEAVDKYYCCQLTIENVFFRNQFMGGRDEYSQSGASDTKEGPPLECSLTLPALTRYIFICVCGVRYLG